MTYTMKEVLEFVEENDVKFIRLAFCDILGTQKNISIMSQELERAFEQGISFDASSILGFMNVEKSDLFLHPDPSTLSILPWRPQQGRVIRFFCDIKHPDGRAFEGDTRNILKKAVSRAEKMGYICKIGSECEFYLFETDEKGRPTYIPHDEGRYLDIAPLDKGENVRREICLSLEQMGIQPESSHHEQGPGQNEIDFKYSDALTAADNLMTFKAVVKAVASRNGLFASFMPKPILSESGSGLHINLSLSKDGLNIFKERDNDSSAAKSFIAGVIDRMLDITAFSNSITNSYARFGSFRAPKFVSWSHQNRSQLIRIPAETGEYSRMELRSPDPACNPYITFALILHAGLDGIERKLELSEPINNNLYNSNGDELRNIKALPENLKQALDIASKSSFVKSILGEEMLGKYLEIKFEEWERYFESEDKESIEKQMYFRRI
ncbi:type I glutamate--ammonia ligase [Acetivibrio mesophilus]|uniref:Glutamine synthetase n=1 Tax=Acetivibrio mesophilus TaxID=2487273 RepID=A0A4Q0I5E9_9FIRM|nr:type I glutamate--ammonia ligase [Acetivibrio mesophilus]RXE58202.1 type I glutamate--ammonia ligase [Acetivibrio mesophilus]HHV29258.1 type I glutamate--ammonia ligase [Clostridium sp.]